jgi:hypothetical protein
LEHEPAVGEGEGGTRQRWRRRPSSRCATQVSGDCPTKMLVLVSSNSSTFLHLTIQPSWAPRIAPQIWFLETIRTTRASLVSRGQSRRWRPTGSWGVETAAATRLASSFATHHRLISTQSLCRQQTCVCSWQFKSIFLISASCFLGSRVPKKPDCSCFVSWSLGLNLMVL